MFQTNVEELYFSNRTKKEYVRMEIFDNLGGMSINEVQFIYSSAIFIVNCTFNVPEIPSHFHKFTKSILSISISLSLAFPGDGMTADLLT